MLLSMKFLLLYRKAEKRSSWMPISTDFACRMRYNGDTKCVGQGVLCAEYANGQISGTERRKTRFCHTETAQLIEKRRIYVVELKTEPQRMTAEISGELDHHHAKEIRETVDFAVREQLPSVLILDFRKVTFMDSSGIGLIMGRSHLMEEYGGVLEIHNPSPQIRKVLRLSGADRLAVIRNTCGGKV